MFYDHVQALAPKWNHSLKAVKASLLAGPLFWLRVASAHNGMTSALDIPHGSECAGFMGSGLRVVWETPKLCPLSSVFPHEIPPNLAIAHLGSSCHPNRKLHETPPPVPKTWWPATSPLTEWFHYSTTKMNEKENWKKKKSCWWLLVTSELDSGSPSPYYFRKSIKMNTPILSCYTKLASVSHLTSWSDCGGNPKTLQCRYCPSSFSRRQTHADL